MEQCNNCKEIIVTENEIHCIGPCEKVWHKNCVSTVFGYSVDVVNSKEFRLKCTSCTIEVVSEDRGNPPNELGEKLIATDTESIFDDVLSDSSTNESRSSSMLTAGESSDEEDIKSAISANASPEPVSTPVPADSNNASDQIESLSVAKDTPSKESISSPGLSLQIQDLSIVDGKTGTSNGDNSVVDKEINRVSIDENKPVVTVQEKLSPRNEASTTGAQLEATLKTENGTSVSLDKTSHAIDTKIVSEIAATAVKEEIKGNDSLTSSPSASINGTPNNINSSNSNETIHDKGTATENIPLVKDLLSMIESLKSSMVDMKAKLVANTETIQILKQEQDLLNHENKSLIRRQIAHNSSIQNLTTENTLLTTKQEELRTSLHRLRGSVWSIRKSLNKVMTEVEELSEVRTNVSEDMDNTDDKQEEIWDRLIQIECAMFEHDLVISGLPEKPNERLDEMVILIAAVYNYILEGSDIVEVFREFEKLNNQPRRIIVKFASMNTKNEFLKQVAARGVVTANIINKDFSIKRKISIEKRCSPNAVKLLALVKQKIDHNQQRSAWIEDGRVFVSRNGIKDPFEVMFTSDLDVLDDM
ncbi:uncharacterized protein LOC105703781 [Orussus abietinus]|uniref:uncharacterized protein LOC105703781 n=1 Tax=Orussus abietinus TaxID=222816 RepID=UPI00062591F8|nr:uncharacterized protein LOC105703781 [Orussus abietinus]